MNKIVGAVKKNKNIIIVVSVILIILVLGLIIKSLLFPTTRGSVYGDRLKNIDNYKIKNQDIKDIKKELNDQTAVERVSYNNEGRILCFLIYLDTEIKVDDAKKYANIVIDKLSNKIKKYYDIQIIFCGDKKSTVYPIAGYKSKSSEEFVWSGNRE